MEPAKEDIEQMYAEAVKADREAKKNFVGCSRCFEHVPREEANTAKCSGCIADTEREWQRMGAQLEKNLAKISK